MSDAINRKEILDRCVELKKVPREFQKVEAFWGYPEFLEYADSLLVVEKERQHREGFPEGIYREIAELRKIFIEHPYEVMAPDLAASEKVRLERLLATEREREREMLLLLR